jgi:hypothetical protein
MEIRRLSSDVSAQQQRLHAAGSLENRRDREGRRDHGDPAALAQMSRDAQRRRAGIEED